MPMLLNIFFVTYIPDKYLEYLSRLGISVCIQPYSVPLYGYMGLQSELVKPHTMQLGITAIRWLFKELSGI